jgi:hypothetical protein
MTSLPVRIITLTADDTIDFHSIAQLSNEPILFRGLVISHWHALSAWSLSQLALTFADNSALVEAQFSPLTNTNASANTLPVGEVDRTRLQCTVPQFVNQFVTPTDVGELSPLRQSHWGYISYCYLRELLDDECPPALIDWTRFCATATSLDTTLWIGTAGSFTPCHYDSYGCNWVAQIDGRKRWRVWPPNSAVHMAPTRVPFEESTVWSAVPIAQHSGGFEAVLEPGDVLFVPHHWWHFVESLTDSVAANLWVPHANDPREEEKEAVVRLLAECLLGSRSPAEQQRLVNPGEVLGFRNENLDLVASVLGLPFPVLVEDYFRIEYFVAALRSERVLHAARAFDHLLDVEKFANALVAHCTDQTLPEGDDSLPVAQLMHISTQDSVLAAIVHELRCQAASRSGIVNPLPVGIDGTSISEYR